ncbi:MAG: hypothetical protein IPL12_06175 [Bacteroidetes bacterium]|nr:hypothetical protein [Bacteroidota bacterium]
MILTKLSFHGELMESIKIIILQKMQKGHTKITCAGPSTIYPNEMINVVYFNFTLPRTTLKENLEQLKIKFRLYYPNGEDELDANLLGFYEKIVGQI